MSNHDPLFPPSAWRSVVAIAIVAFAQMISGCHPAMTSTASQNAAAGFAADRPYTGTVADWPLFFKRHLFGAVCFDTRGCKIEYAGIDHGNAKDTPPASVHTPERYDEIMVASYGDIANFASPAKLEWRAKNGEALSTEVDFAMLFKDQLVRHNVPREQIPEDASIGFTHIVLEVNDRTVNVYTRTMIPTKDAQIPGNRFSYSRNDLIRVYSHTY
jgi:hypothetical protein